MNLLEIFIINVTFVTFPILIYLLLDGFKTKFMNKENDAYLEITLFGIFFILSYFYKKFDIVMYICFFSIPILLAMLFDKAKCAGIISVILIFFILENFNFSKLFIISMIIIYNLLYIYYKVRSIKRIYFIISFIFITFIFLTSYFLLFDSISSAYIKILVLYIISIYTIITIISKIYSYTRVYKSLKDMQNDKNLRLMVLKITHEIKNQIFIIKGYNELINKNYEKNMKYKDIMNKQIDNILSTLKDFNELNNVSINKEVVNFNIFIKNIEETIIPFFNDKNISYNINIDDNINISIDEKRIKQVFINLIKNSIEASNNNGKVEINIKRLRKNLNINISDNGCGMDKKTLDHLFTPFYSMKEYGTGLGLCFCKEVIQAHKGSIKYTSVLNKGTNVYISIPLNNKDSKNFDNKLALVCKG